LDSLKALGNGVSLHFDSSTVGVRDDDLAIGIAETIKAWSQMEWYAFGYDLGKLLQALVSSVFPQKYAVDHAALVRADLKGVARLSGVAPMNMWAIASVVMFSLVALLSLRGRRPVGHALVPCSDQGDFEDVWHHGAE